MNFSTVTPSVDGAGAQPLWPVALYGDAGSLPGRLAVAISDQGTWCYAMFVIPPHCGMHGLADPYNSLYNCKDSNRAAAQTYVFQ